MAHWLRDVARQAGVSLATASRVVSNADYPVSDAVRERVLRTVDELDYTPSALARALVTRHSRLLAVIVGDIADPYFAEIARGVEDVARQAGYLTFVCSTDRTAATELQYIRLLSDYHAEGIIFAGGGAEDDSDRSTLERTVERAQSRGIRVVALSSRSFASVSVQIDNEAACAELTSYLIGLGHRRIAYVDGPPGLSTSHERRSGFSRAMQESGLDESLIYPGRFDYESGRAAASDMAAHGWPDAVVAANDVTAVGVLMGLRDQGVAVPVQVSVAGIDDIRMAQFLDLTTIRVPMYELGAEAVRIILASDRPDEAKRTLLPHKIVVRGSTQSRKE